MLDSVRYPSGEPNLESVYKCGDVLDAELVRGLLESRGITAKVVSCDQWVGKTAILGVRGLTGIEVAVPPCEADQAREILREAAAGDLEIEGDLPEDKVQCPNCASENVRRESASGVFFAGLGICSLLMIYLLINALTLFNLLLFMVFLVFAAVMLLGRDTWRCGDCKHSWKD